MDETRRRWRGLERAAALLPRGARAELGSWERLVGPTLAAETAMVGLDEAGVLRVAARNEAARQELLARSMDLLAAFNLQANAMGRRPATRVACWVASAFSVSPARAVARRRAPPPPIAPELLEEARAEVARLAPGVSPAIAESLARARARALARGRRSGG